MKPDLINNAFALVLLKQRKVAGMSRLPEFLNIKMIISITYYSCAKE